MSVAHTVLVAFSPSSISRLRLYQIIHVTVKIHLQIDAHTPVKSCSGTVDIKIGNAHFDNLGEYLAALLLGGDAHFDLAMARVEKGADGCGQAENTRLRELEKGVTFIGVNIRHRNTVL